MASMFAHFISLTSLDLSSFDLSNVTTYDTMFIVTSKLTTIYVKDNEAKNFIEARLADVNKIGVTVSVAA